MHPMADLPNTPVQNRGLHGQFTEHVELNQCDAFSNCNLLARSVEKDDSELPPFGALTATNANWEGHNSCVLGPSYMQYTIAFE